MTLKVSMPLPATTVMSLSSAVDHEVRHQLHDLANRPLLQDFVESAEVNITGFRFHLELVQKWPFYLIPRAFLFFFCTRTRVGDTVQHACTLTRRGSSQTERSAAVSGQRELPHARSARKA